jgi:hypothetical protein
LNTALDYNFHLLRGIQKMAATKSGFPKNRLGGTRGHNNALMEMDLQQILKASTAGEETITEFFS